MTHQLAPVIAVLAILIGQLYSLLEKSTGALYAGLIIAGIFAVTHFVSRKPAVIPWWVERLRETVRYFLLWIFFPIFCIILLSLGGAYSIGALIGIPLMIYLDRVLASNQLAEFQGCSPMK